MILKQYNKRALNSKLKIGSGLVNILLNKKLQDVTVCELEKESHVSRSTFYRNFNNVYESGIFSPLSHFDTACLEMGIISAS